MRLLAKRSCTMSFTDSDSQEALLEFAWRDGGSIEMAFRLYDAAGLMVADSGGYQPVATTLIAADSGEVLLDIPSEAATHIKYRLYSRNGNLLTASDGVRTQVYRLLKMETTGMAAGSSH